VSVLEGIRRTLDVVKLLSEVRNCEQVRVLWSMEMCRNVAVSLSN